MPVKRTERFETYVTEDEAAILQSIARALAKKGMLLDRYGRKVEPFQGQIPPYAITRYALERMLRRDTIFVEPPPLGPVSRYAITKYALAEMVRTGVDRLLAEKKRERGPE